MYVVLMYFKIRYSFLPPTSMGRLETQSWTDQVLESQLAIQTITTRVYGELCLLCGISGYEV